MENTAGKKKKIVYLITVSEFGGAQKYVYDLSNHLTASGNYDVIVGASKFNGDLFGKLKQANIPCRELKYLKREISPFWDVVALFEIVRFLKKEKPDIVHLNSTKISILGSVAAWLAGVPKIIYTAHGWVFNEALPPLKKTIYKFAEKMTASLKTSIINVSEYDMSQAKKNGIHPKNQMTVIHNGIDPEMKFLEKRFARHELNKKINSPHFSTAEIVIGTVAYFYKNKGLEYLIEAAHLLKENGEIEKQKMVFLMIGEGLEEKNLKDLVKKYGLQNYVFMPGKIMDFSKYLKAFDIFALTSVKEGLPFTALEAGAAALPIITTRVGGLPELIKNGESGIVVEPKNIPEIAKAVKTLSEDPVLRAKYGAKINETVRTEYSAKTMLKKTVEMYN